MFFLRHRFFLLNMVFLFGAGCVKSDATYGECTETHSSLLKILIPLFQCGNSNAGHKTISRPHCTVKTTALYIIMVQEYQPERNDPTPLFAITDVLLKDLVKRLSREHECCNDRIAFKFNSHICFAAAEAPVKHESDWKSLDPNLAALRLRDVLR